ncbi:hypothetical protein PVMG_06020 [Plasmodium vivax Mauritania I]|uniref:Uncharacterized protein n=1 Tax=Plasmodium vivax Mauritania I TaxID=1035515 RepID=A0A0J9W3X9_PLAVI|nr:hypothetical protein PVMG_06020 [Plasmodium vivax Mauritania I]
MESKYTSADNSSFCEKINCRSHKEEQIKKICKMFVSLYNNSKTQCRNNANSRDCLKYPEFMNFWLNYELNRAGYSETEQRQFYNEMTGNSHTFKDDSILKVKLYVIVEKYFNNMNTLYKLYKMLYSPSEEEDTKCDELTEEFKKIYNEGLKKCYHHELEKFRDLYMQKNLHNINSCIKKKIHSLPELSLFESTNKNKLKSSNIASELLQYKHNYSMDYLPEIKDDYYKDLKDLVSVHYNLLFEYKEEEQNCLMIRILHQFFQYCNDYKYNRKLSSFMQEFIKEYYEKYKTQYVSIFNECKINKNKKEYCTLYKKCESSFKTDLKTFENKASDYIKEQDDYFNNLTQFDFLLFETKAMFQDFEKMSRYLPTIMSTMAAILICLFFLYKVLKFYI